MEEVQQHWLSGPYTRAQLDEIHGRDCWRPIRRRCIWQPSHAKYRLIDNARASAHNSAAAM
eukprot:4285747-Amphidinium_carterae.1